MFENREKRTELSDLGEFGLIEHLTKDIPHLNKSTIKGVGDDAAVIDSDGKKILISTDLLIEGVHFDLSYTPLKHLGYKAAIVNFSDIAAMNATPSQITVSIAVSNRFSLEAVEEIYSGIRLACKKYKVDLIGGDTSTSITGMFISITVIGFTHDDEIVYRSTANDKDLICVSGDLGAAYAGLLVLEREKEVFKVNPDMQPDLSDNDYVLKRFLKPEARTDIVELLKEKNILPTSMIDISDGLASELLHLCKESKLGCNLYEDKIPLDPTTVRLAEEFEMDQTIMALSGGEDYELLFTVHQLDFEKVRELQQEISVIGFMSDQEAGANLITRSQASVPLTAQGWDGMRRK